MLQLGKAERSTSNVQRPTSKSAPLNVGSSLLLALLAGSTALLATNLPPATVSFLDGSFLRGQINSLDVDTLRWLHPNARAPIEFSTTNLNQVRLPQRVLSLPTNAPPVCRVVLASGDEFEGSLISLDADSFEVDTWFAGRLRGQRAGLQSLAFYGTSQSALYDGPRAADEWTIGTGSATVNRGGVNILGGFGNLLIRPAEPVAIPAPAVVPQVRVVEPAKPIERRALTAEELNRLSADAERSATVAVFLKTDLVKEALKAGHTSTAALEKWFADFKDPNDWAKDEAKAARFKVMLRAEVDVLVRRLQGRAAPFVEAAPGLAPLPVPAADPAGQAVRVEIERAVGKAAPGERPPLPPADLTRRDSVPAAKAKPAPFDITRMSSTARFSMNVADYLKSDLVQLAIESGLVKADAVKAELEKQVAAGGEMRTIILREGALLAARLLRELEHLKNDAAAATLARTQDLLAGAGRGQQPAAAILPPGEGPVGAGGDAAQWRLAADISQKVSAATVLGTAAELLNSDLMKAAVEAGVASQRAEEEWLTRQERNLEGGNENLRAGQLKLILQAEAMLLGIRLLRMQAPAVSANAIQSYEQNRERVLAAVTQQIEARAAGKAAADVLAQARERALGALQLNNPNFIVAGAEAALAGRAAAAGIAATNTAWQFRDGAYYATGVGTLGRECHLPTKARIEFDLAWKGQPFFRFSFFTRNTDTYDYSDGWQFYTSSSGYIYSMRRSGMGASSSSGARVSQMLAKNSVRFTFLVNTEKETVTLLADGERVHEWKNLGSPGPGTGIVFYNYNVSSRVRIGDIRISPWDGRERDAAPPGAPGDDPDKLVEVPPADSAVVEFVNNDRATGTLHGIRDGKLAFNPAGTRLDIPVARTALISFPVADAPTLPKTDGVQVTLHRNERLTLALEKWDPGEIIAVSPVFGRLKLKPESVRTLRFNPSAPRGVTDEWSGL